MNITRLLGGVLTLIIALPVSLSAQAVVVTNTNNSGPGSLRQAIANATLVDPVITFDASLSGKTILLTSGELVINNGFFISIDATALPDGLTISGNNASRVFRVGFSGSAIIGGLTISGGTSGGSGGGILNNGILYMNGCTVSGNQAAVQGGGIYNDSLSVVTTLTNVTLSANTAGNAGGALFNLSGGVKLINTTVSGNTASNFGGGVANDGVTAILSLENSLIAGNSGPAAGFGSDIGNRNGGTITPAGANLVGDNDTVSTAFPAGPLVGTTASPLNPLLAPLGDYSGPTMTRLPLLGSPAIDAAFALGTTPPTDQRVFPRPFGPASDLGSVEVTDTDGDGIDNGYETAVLGTSPNSVDSDNDGLVDGAGGTVAVAVYLTLYPSGPVPVDTDSDGFVDGEQDLGTDPAVSNVGDVAPRGILMTSLTRLISWC